MANLPLLTYAISPTSATVSSTQNFTLTITNPSPQFPVTVKKSTDQIAISNWASLTASFSQISPVAPAGTPWRAGLAASFLKLFVIADTVIGTNESIQFRIENVTIDPDVGQGTLSIVEVVGGQVSNPPDLQIGKLGADLQIFAFADPVTLGKGQKTTLTWTIVKGIYVTVRPPDDGTQYFREGTGPWTHSIQTLPFQDVPQTTFTLTVVQDPANTKSVPITVELSPPVITFFENDPQPPISIDGTLTLTWNAVFATKVALVSPSGSSAVPPAGTRTYQATALHKLVSGNQSQLPFTLNADGYKTPAKSTLVLDLQPVTINWFRWADFAHTQLTYDVSNATGATPPPSGAVPPLVLSATGPHGPVSQVLGGDDVEVLVLYADPQAVSPGQSTMLHYQVQNAVSASLQPGDEPLTFDENGIGEVSVTPPATTKYTVVAVDAAGNRAGSPLTVTVTATTRAKLKEKFKRKAKAKRSKAPAPAKRRGRKEPE